MASEALRVLSATEGGRPIKDESGKAVNVCPQGHFRVGIVGSVGGVRAVTLLDKRHEDPFAPLEVVVGSLVRTARTTSNFAHGERRGPTLIEEITTNCEDCLA